MNRSFVFVLLGAAFFLSSCQRGGSSSPPRKVAVALGAVSEEGGCLNLQKYFEEIRSLDQDLPVLSVSTKLNLDSKKPIREAFKKSLAYGAFEFDQRPLGELTDFPSVRQDDCKTLHVTGADEIAVDYQITNASKDTIVARDLTGRRLRYRWLSPTSVEIETTSIAYDLPCADATEIEVDFAKTLDWSGVRPASIDPSSSFKIDPEFLTNLAHAVGHEPSEFYDLNDESPETVLSTAKLVALSQAPITEDLKSCNRPTAEPEPPAENGTDTGDTPSPGPETPPSSGTI